MPSHSLPRIDAVPLKSLPHRFPIKVGPDLSHDSGRGPKTRCHHHLVSSLATKARGGAQAMDGFS